MLAIVPDSCNLFFTNSYEDRYYYSLRPNKINHVINISRCPLDIPVFYKYHNISIDSLYLTEDILHNIDERLISVCEEVYQYIENNASKNILISYTDSSDIGIAVILYYICRKHDMGYIEAYNRLSSVTRFTGFKLRVLDIIRKWTGDFQSSPNEDLYKLSSEELEKIAAGKSEEPEDILT